MFFIIDIVVLVLFYLALIYMQIYNDFEVMDVAAYLEIKKMYNDQLERMNGIPNYNNRVYHLNNIFNLVEIMKIKNSSKEFLITYMGVDDEHKGLARALSQLILVEIEKRDATFVGALIKQGTATSNIVKEILKFKYNYVLMNKKLKG